MTNRTNYRTKCLGRFPSYDSYSYAYDVVFSFFDYYYGRPVVNTGNNSLVQHSTLNLGSSSWITVLQAHCNADATGSAYQQIQSLPFGEQFIEQRQSSWDAMYKFTGKPACRRGRERDMETGFDYFGARYLAYRQTGYDSDLSVWLSLDPLSDMYPSTSPFMYVRGNPVMLVDPDGREVIGTDGQAVTYTKDKNGNITWSEIASDDTKEIGNAMLKTRTGEKALRKMQKSETKFNLTINRQENPEGKLGELVPTKDDQGYEEFTEYGEYKEVKMIIYEKSIKRDSEKGSGKRFEGAAWEEALGAVATHEVYHNNWRQIKLDVKIPDETKQNPKRNLPINMELRFRREYQEMHPELKEKSKEGMEIYKSKGYRG